MSGLIGLYRSGLWRAVAPKQGERANRQKMDGEASKSG